MSLKGCGRPGLRDEAALQQDEVGDAGIADRRLRFAQ
jgi:hypothetical protein